MLVSRRERGAGDPRPALFPPGMTGDKEMDCLEYWYKMLMNKVVALPEQCQKGPFILCRQEAIDLIMVSIQAFRHNDRLTAVIAGGSVGHSLLGLRLPGPFEGFSMAQPQASPQLHAKRR